jgi:hypothetical protein|tara:strand:- start:207 stop:392 length:186 start_codon:yes stop_codon:yes gene_type:complete
MQIKLEILNEIFDDIEETNCSLRELTDDELIDCRKTLEQRLQRVLKTIINHTENRSIHNAD